MRAGWSVITLTALAASFCLGVGVYDAMVGVDPAWVAAVLGLGLFNMLMCLWNISITRR